MCEGFSKINEELLTTGTGSEKLFSLSIDVLNGFKV